MDDHGLLFNAFVFLAAAVITVPLATRAGIGSILGYLLAGMAIGPFGLRLVTDPQDILHFAEFGVVLLLFLIGMELNPRRLWAMRRPILGTGGLQVLVTALVIGMAGSVVGLDWRSAAVAGMGLALSSTAMALQLLRERNLLATPGGGSAFSVLLFQDIAVIPMLAVIPLLATGEAPLTEPTGWIGLVEIVGVIALIVIGGRYLLRPLFRVVAATRLREVSTAFSLLLVIGIALLMQAVEMSMALGAFLAGVLLAESEYRHALESDIEPFKGLLLGLFFISVGMSIDFALLLQRPGLVLSLVAALVLSKLALLYALARLADLPVGQRLMFAFILSQGGEFAFVLFSVAGAAGALSPDTAGLLVLVVALSMMTTPLLLMAHARFVEPRFTRERVRPMDRVEDEHNPVLIAGFGRFGQIVGRLLHANGIGTTILDHDPDHVDMVRKLGFKVFYGDASRLDLLRAAGAEQARMLVLAIDDREKSLKLVEMVRQQFPDLTVLTRAWDVAHQFELLERGCQAVERETFEGALRLGERALIGLGLGAWRAKQVVHRFRAHDEELLEELYRHFQEDIEIRATILASARQRFEEEIQADELFYAADRDAEWR
jgi:glutathione-regulated potassium-efflux system ancillary protein KefC